MFNTLIGKINAFDKFILSFKGSIEVSSDISRILRNLIETKTSHVKLLKDINELSGMKRNKK